MPELRTRKITLIHKSTDFSLAIIADIHGNSWALEAVLRDIQHRNIQQIVNLGDCLLGPLDPAGTANRLIDLNILTIQGNDDRILLSPPEHPSAATSYTLKHLEPEHLEWVPTLVAIYKSMPNCGLCGKLHIYQRNTYPTPRTV